MVVGQALAGRRQHVAVQQAGIQQLLDDHGDAADIVEIERHVLSARLEVGDIGRLLEDLGDVVQVELDAAFVRHRRQMQAGIGRAAGGGDHDGGVLEGLARADIARPDAELQQVHRRLARGFGVLVARLVGRRRAGRAGQRKPDRLGYAGHGVGGELAAA